LAPLFFFHRLFFYFELLLPQPGIVTRYAARQFPVNSLFAIIYFSFILSPCVRIRTRPFFPHIARTGCPVLCSLRRPFGMASSSIAKGFLFLPRRHRSLRIKPAWNLPLLSISFSPSFIFSPPGMSNALTPPFFFRALCSAPELSRCPLISKGRAQSWSPPSSFWLFFFLMISQSFFRSFRLYRCSPSLSLLDRRST